MAHFSLPVAHLPSALMLRPHGPNNPYDLPQIQFLSAQEQYHLISQFPQEKLFDVQNLLAALAEMDPDSLRRVLFEVNIQARKTLMRFPDIRLAFGSQPSMLCDFNFHFIPKRSRNVAKRPADGDWIRFYQEQHKQRAQQQSIEHEPYEGLKRLFGEVNDYAEFQDLPAELMLKIITYVDSVSDLDCLSQTCRRMRDMIEEINVASWIPDSLNDPMCYPFPHAVCGAIARDLADWMYSAEGEIKQGVLRHLPIGTSPWSREQHLHLFKEAVKEDGNFGLMYLGLNKVGLTLEKLRSFQNCLKKLQFLEEFNMTPDIEVWLEQNRGLIEMANGICRTVAVANKLIYGELFHHDVDNLLNMDRFDDKSLGYDARWHWFTYCVPTMNLPLSPACLWQYQGLDRFILRSLLESWMYEQWTLEIKLSWRTKVFGVSFNGDYSFHHLSNLERNVIDRIGVIQENTMKLATEGVPKGFEKEIPMFFKFPHPYMDKFFSIRSDGIHESDYANSNRMRKTVKLIGFHGPLTDIDRM